MVFKGRVLLNDTGIDGAELIEYSKTSTETGLTISLDPPGLSFKSFGKVVLGYPSTLSEDDAERLLRGLLFEIRVYPEWLVDMAGRMKISGLHTVILVAGDSRFELRTELSKYAKLVLNTGNEDVYISKGKFNVDVDHDGVFISTGYDAIENLRRVYSMGIHTDGKGVKTYSSLMEYNFIGSERMRGILNQMEEGLEEIETLTRVIEALEEELVDLRIPKELFWVMKSLGG